MKMQKMLKRAAAAASGILVFSGTTSMTTAESTDVDKTTTVTASEVSSTAEAETEAASEISAENAEETQKMPEDWDKADISEYDSSLTLISYELATPEMAKIGETPDPLAEPP